MISTQALLFLLRVWRDRRGQDLIDLLEAGRCEGATWAHEPRFGLQECHGSL